MLWISVEKERRFCRIANASRDEELGDWRSLEDPDVLPAGASSTHSLAELLSRASVPIVGDIWKDLEAYVLLSAQGTLLSATLSLIYITAYKYRCADTWKSEALEFCFNSKALTVELLGLRQAVEKVKQQIERQSERLVAEAKSKNEIRNDSVDLETHHVSLLTRYPVLLQVRISCTVICVRTPS